MKSLVVFGGVSLFGLTLMLLACGGGRSPAPTAIAYVAHSQNHSVTVVNIPADKTVARIEIGDSSVTSLTQTASYPQRVAFTPDGSRALRFGRWTPATNRLLRRSMPGHLPKS